LGHKGVNAVTGGPADHAAIFCRCFGETLRSSARLPGSVLYLVMAHA
jgi:hypothetical protein